MDHYNFAQFFGGGAFDPAAAYLAYWRSAEIDWSSLSRSDCWFLYSFADGKVHRLSATKFMSHERPASGELDPAQIIAAHVITQVIEESYRCVIADAVVYLGLFPRSDEAFPSGPLASPGVVVDVLHVDLDAEGDWNCRISGPLASLMLVTVCKGTFHFFKRSRTSFELTIRLTPGTNFD